MRTIQYDYLERNGRLGNQAAQIAWMIGQGKVLKRQPKIKPDWVYRPYFSIPDEYYGVSDPSDDILDGGTEYYQEFRYFSHCEDQIREFFQPSKAASIIVEKQIIPIIYPSVCGIHVRRGDYVGLPNHFPLPTQLYFEKCTALERLKDPATVFAVFSDDTSWCRNNINYLGLSDSDHIVFMDGNELTPVEVIDRIKEPTDQYDMFALARCDSIIMSNSTFSFWAAFIGGDSAQRVYYPSVWFGPELAGIDWQAMFPRTVKWKMIQC